MTIPYLYNVRGGPVLGQFTCGSRTRLPPGHLTVAGLLC